MRYVLLFGVMMLGGFATIACAQASDPASYFPLHLGDTWAYYYLTQRSGTSPIDTVYADPVSIEMTVEIDGQTYYVYPHFSEERLVRKDEVGRVFWREGDQDVLWLDPTIAPGTTYEFADPSLDPTDPNALYVVTVIEVSYETVAGRFEHALQFDFDIPQAVDDAFGYVLAPGIGIVNYRCCMGESEWLYKAVIEGITLTDTEKAEPPPTALKLMAYPNPFADGVNLTLDVPPGMGPTEVTVFDVLGRRVRTLLQGWSNAGPQRLEWDGLDEGGRAVAPGFYFVRMKAGDHVQSLTVLRIHR